MKLLLVAAFWSVAAAGFVQPTPRMRGLFLACFFGLLVASGLTHVSAWPFFTWDMWHRVESSTADWWELSLVDSTGEEWRYDFAAVPPAGAPALETKCGRLLLEEPGRAPDVAQWLLERARLLRDSPGEIRPQWWSTDLGFLPVGPAPRESWPSWSRDAARPGEFIALVARKRRVHFSQGDVPARDETVEEKRFPWTGS